MSLATQTLKLTVREAAQFWLQLRKCRGEEELEELFNSLWTNQTEQAHSADCCAALAQQLDLEITAAKARLEKLIELHKRHITKLETQRQQVDQTIIKLNETGELISEIEGKDYRITIRENPPTCQLSVKPEELPEEYRTTKTKVTTIANKKAIVAAWKQGVAVAGTKVYRKRRVAYEISTPN